MFSFYVGAFYHLFINIRGLRYTEGDFQSTELIGWALYVLFYSITKLITLEAKPSDSG